VIKRKKVKLLMIKKIKNFLVGVVEGIKIGFVQQKTYIPRLYAWLIADIFQLGVMTMILTTALQYSQDFSQNEIIIYYLLVVIVARVTFDFTHERLIPQILSGDFSKHLLRPGGYLPVEVGETIAGKSIRILTALPLVVVLVYFGINSSVFSDIGLTQILIFILALFLGAAMNFVLGNLFALSAFYVKQIYGLKSLYNNLILILSGEYLPIRLMPSFLGVIVMYLPYRYSLSFPIEIIMSWVDMSTIWVDVLIGASWLFVLSVLTIALYRKSVLKFEAEGI
jgi:ABC-2 type transport system permease protein